jgi:hypothetical protein
VRPPSASAPRPTRRSVLLSAVLGTLAVGGCADPVVQVTGQAPPDRSTAYREHAVQAVERVEALWGAGTVPRQVRLELPGDVARWSAATGHPPEQTDIPASTLTRGESATVVLHPRAWDRLTVAGRQAVLTHEVTHLAQPPGDAPWWLVEGSAEFTAHRGSGASPASIMGTRAWSARVEDPPTAWPEPDPGGRWSAYADAWSVCLAVADEHGDEAVPRWHTAVAAAGDLDAGSRAALQRSAADVRRSWEAWWERQSR